MGVSAIYRSAFQSLIRNPLVYPLLLLWILTQGLILLVFALIGGGAWFATLLTAVLSSKDSTLSILGITSVFVIFYILLVTFLSATTRAAVLGFGAIIRKGKQPSTLDFLNSLFRYAFPLFIGGLIIGMLTAVPVLTFLNFIVAILRKIPLDIFTSGWNYSHAVTFLGFFLNLLLITSTLQAFIFLWIAPWDEMLVLYNLSFSEALVRSFYFVFSRDNFLRVVALVVCNNLLGATAAIVGNLGIANEMATHNTLESIFVLLVTSPGSSLSSLLFFILYPFFAFTQIYLLPYPYEKATQKQSEQIYESIIPKDVIQTLQ